MALDRSCEPIVTEVDIAGRAEPVRRCLAMTGSLGKPRSTEVGLVFEARMFGAPDAAPKTREQVIHIGPGG
jgi:hypothetical protein